ncbi:MAG: DUF465 domain-containing protein [Candidatus Schekmanbacteria bacterium]|nr:DUF465 domain-containing protein [Candidatus Schekmanbacteria bacterium]
MNESQIRNILRKENDEFQRLEEKHHQYEKELDDIANLTFTSPEDELKKAELKKKKLKIKDKLYEIISNYEKEHGNLCL